MLFLTLNRYFWSPVKVDDTIESLSVEWNDLFTVDVKTGEFGFPKGKRYEAESGSLTGNASVVVQVWLAPLIMTYIDEFDNTAQCFETQISCWL
jgi:hypothetical protein